MALLHVRVTVSQEGGVCFLSSFPCLNTGDCWNRHDFHATISLTLHFYASDIRLSVMAWTDIFSNIWSRLRLPTRFTRDLLIGIAVGITFSLSSTSLALLAQGWRRRRAVQRIPPRPIQLRSNEVVPGVIGLIGACTCLDDSGLTNR